MPGKEYCLIETFSDPLIPKQTCAPQQKLCNINADTPVIPLATSHGMAFPRRVKQWHVTQ